jgi:hypothetical protein
MTTSSPPSTPTHTVALLESYTNRLVAWLEGNGWSGWDPYDLWDHRFGIWALAGTSLSQRVAASTISRLEVYFPLALRRLVGARPEVNAKAMGLFAAAFLELEWVEGAPRRIRGASAADQCFDWLDSHRVSLGDGTGWGYPFDWRTRVLIPRNTPTVVTSAFVGDAYWLRYRRRGDAAALRRCEEVCRFILGSLNRSAPQADGAFCFSYTPLDHFQVHNANLLAAEFLVRIGSEVGREDWVQTGLDAGRFALHELREDGTLNYWSMAQSDALEQYLYHAGFEIRMLDSIARCTGREEFRRAADRYFQTWLQTYFAPDGTPLMTAARPGTVEVHSCAESLLCAAQLAGRPGLAAADLPSHLARSLNATARHLWIPTTREAGYFASTSRRRFGLQLRTTIPFIRWGQAWMLRAMAGALVAVRADP